MYRTITILYLVCIGCYILFTRQPDYFDGELAPAHIHWQTDSLHTIPVPMAVFNNGLRNYAIDARYVFRRLPEGEQVTVIYENSDPGRAAVYSVWGYWFRWGELLMTILLYIGLFQVALALNRNPTPESVMEQLADPEEKKRKYIA